MSIKPEYFEYLKHFGKTVPVRILHEQPETDRIVALRHDVDHDLDLALEMSYRENRHGCKSTYYILHDAAYWNDPCLLQKCLQIQDFGHEIGLHLNMLSRWIEGAIDDPGKELAAITGMFREAGIQVTGISAHGDRLCYRHQFINYWLFSELKPAMPETRESGRSAEGIPASDKAFAIQYPEKHLLSRPDGARLNLWSYSMNKLGLQYCASHVPYTRYFSDSHGQWTDTLDPRTCALGTDRVQVLLHPSHWRGPKRYYFFLSTARSGSKWLANILNQATSLTALHEFSLNHRLTGSTLTDEKNTADGFTELIGNRKKAHTLLQESRNWIEKQDGDCAEANIYLEQFLPELKTVFPDAETIFLHRNPEDIVRSLINRDWYDTPEDTRHPVMNVKGWDTLSQFEKACWYVSRTHQKLLDFCASRISFEAMTTDRNYLERTLLSLDVPFFPRLASKHFSEKINANYNYSFPAFEQWSKAQQTTFRKICGPTASKLTYDVTGIVHDTVQEKGRKKHWPWFKRLYRNIENNIMENSKTVLIDFPAKHERFSNVFGYSCTVLKTPERITITPVDGKKAYILLNGKSWHTIRPFKGWKAIPRMYYRGSAELETGKDCTAQIFCLMYDRKRSLLFKRRLGGTRKQTALIPFSFSLRGDAKTFNIALYFSGPELTEPIILKHFFLECAPLKQHSL